MVRLRLTLLFFGLNSFLVGAQVKVEREFSVSEKEVPKEAVLFVSKFKFPKKIHWFVDENATGFTYEAKSKLNKQLYSIEFEKNGELKDVELRVSCAAIPENVLSNICVSITAYNKKFKIVKIQEQYSGDTSLILDKLVYGKQVDLLPFYEIVVKHNENGEGVQYEYTFNEKGNFIKREQIQINSTSNLEF